jgi:hypothetical protein
MTTLMHERITEYMTDSVTLTPLGPDTTETCDRESSGGTQALFRVAFQGGGELALCGHCLTRAGWGNHWEMDTWLTMQGKEDQ